MEIFVGNLSFDSTEADVKKLFEGFGNVASAVIVMRKEKNAPKSRGFGFVQMPDEGGALAAIAALNAKEFMGRVINVNPARPKTEAQRKSELKKKIRPRFEAGTEQYPREGVEQKKTWFNPGFRKPGAYKGGRRTHSYIKRQRLSGMQEEVKPRPSSQDNPMRWRKRRDQVKPWQKSPGEHKPWEKPAGEARPWKKAEGEFKPWRKSEGGSKPWRKTPGESKPWKKAEGEPKPWKKAEGEPRPWSKSSERPQKSGFKDRRKPGGYSRAGDRNRKF